MTTILSKKEFEIFLMLYAANVDGNISKDELKIILSNTDKETYDFVNDYFQSHNDAECLDIIKENKAKHILSIGDKASILSDIHDIFVVDNLFDNMERLIMRNLNRFLD